ncbi:MAG: DNA-binding response regulator [marine bacterium B5-7]|nr:MAG: DNA-binding response regulator [marine bacterium B5-7]
MDYQYNQNRRSVVITRLHASTRLMTHILLIDDDERLGPLLAEYFQRYNLNLEAVVTPQEGLDRLNNENFDLVILDVMLPDFDGFEACRRIRRGNDIPIIMLTARGDVLDRVVGLEIGADDYLAKPFEPRELVARVHNILKRSRPVTRDSGVLLFGELAIDLARRRVDVDGEDVQLTGREYELLVLLARQPRKKFTRDEIISELRGSDAQIYSRAVDISISRLRQKLKPLDPIRTVRGTGYEFVP